MHGGFDALIGNPPWDRMKLQQVEWFAARRPDIAMAPRAADRKRMIADLKTANDPLARDFATASAQAATAARMARKGGDYPLLSGGDLNLYSLFVERAMTLVKPGGLVGLLVPSGIASDKTAARFFKGVATEGRLKAYTTSRTGARAITRRPSFPTSIAGSSSALSSHPPLRLPTAHSAPSSFRISLNVTTRNVAFRCQQRISHASIRTPAPRPFSVPAAMLS